MIKIIFWFFKFAIFACSVGVTMIYLMPQHLLLDDQNKRDLKSIAEDKDYLQGSIKPFNLFCRLNDVYNEMYDDAEMITNLNLQKNTTLIQSLGNYAKCISMSPKISRNDCYCLNSYFVSITVICTSILSLQYAFRMVIICMTPYEKRLSKIQSGVMSSLAFMNFLSWIALGYLQYDFIVNRWPFTYYDSFYNFRRYYSVPQTFMIAMYVSLGTGLLSLTEGVVWICFVQKAVKTKSVAKDVSKK